ncbi:MAG: DUF4338 domain-containing protein [Acidobacteria bacterium]|nr:DUF4338 domain-containing protein [Acidobacteriota bacterium]MYH48692.1 DUF4338 domain-containing protein [Gammaproteobacteria bacterium]MYK80102.1 DUF4338 domain-containing protein [Acidobacteriota bacterium]
MPRTAATATVRHPRSGPPATLRTVVRGTREGRLWNEFVARYHDLDYTTLVGDQMRYAVHARHDRPLAMLGFPAAADAPCVHQDAGFPPRLSEGFVAPAADGKGRFQRRRLRDLGGSPRPRGPQSGWPRSGAVGHHILRLWVRSESP